MHRTHWASMGLGVVFAINAQAATVIEQNFEGLVTPNYGQPVFTANNPIVNGWYGTGSEGEWWGSNNPETSDAQAYSANQSIVFTPRVDEQGAYVGNRQLVARNSQFGLESGDFEFSLRLYQQASEGVNNANWYATISNSAGRAAAVTEITLRAVGQNLYVGFDKNPSEGTVVLPADQWFGLRVLGNIDDAKYSTYIDTGSGWTLIDQDRGFNVGVALNTGHATDHDLDGVYFVSNGGFNGANNTIYIDDMYLGTPVPEPAMLGLAGLAGTMMLRRKR